MKMTACFRMVLAALFLASVAIPAVRAEAKISSASVKQPAKVSVDQPSPEGNTSKASRGFQLLVLLKMLK